MMVAINFYICAESHRALSNNKDAISHKSSLQFEGSYHSNLKVLTKQAYETMAEFQWMVRDFKYKLHSNSVEPQVFVMNFGWF